VNAIRRAWPNTRISWVIQPLPYRLIHNHPAVDEFIVVERRRRLAAARPILGMRKRLRHRRFDLLLALQPYLKAGLITSMVDAPVKLGFDRRRAKDLNWLVTTHRIPARPVRHVQDQN